METLRAALAELLLTESCDLFADVEDFTTRISLPTTTHGPQASPALLPSNGSVRPARLRLATWAIPALRVRPRAVLGLLIRLPGEAAAAAGIKMGADLRFWQQAAWFALSLLTRQRFEPTLIEADGSYLAIWRPLLDESDDCERLEHLAREMPPICRAFSADREATPAVLLHSFIAAAVNAFARHHAQYGRYQPGQHRGAAHAWLKGLALGKPVLEGSSPTLQAFRQQYEAWSEPIPGLAGSGGFRLCLRLEPPDAMGGGAPPLLATDDQDWTLRYFLQATDDPSLLVPAESVWRGRRALKEFIDRRLDFPEERLLVALGHASRLFPPIEASLHSAHPSECHLTTSDAYTFIQETALLLQSLGFGVLVPDRKAKLSVRVRLRPGRREAPKGGVAALTFESIVNYDWQLALGGEPLSADEFEKLANLKVPLVRVRGQWLELQPEQVQQVVSFWRQRRDLKELTLLDALRLGLGSEGGGGGGAPMPEVAAEGWVADLLRQLADGERLAQVPVPDDFRGTLRPYQAAGLSWLAFLRRWRLGACLADDMGLGKTIQVIALLLHARAEANDDSGPTLIICPTSVVSNWARELSRFAPDLRVMVYHGAGRSKIRLAEQTVQHDVVLTSYALLQRDEASLVAVEWSAVISDEAQNIKNPGTKQAQAARKLSARWRLAMTGTPIENRLTELWSILQFLNPGYLGSQDEFRRRFAIPIERTADPEATERLKALVGPFILRRLKTDPNVITDLPAKNEMKVHCPLTREQATLYEAVVRDALSRIADSEGIERRGLVLATLMKLKQVCNHPAQFLGDGSAPAGRSGKLMRLVEMLEEVRTVDERALVFTQFAEMGHLLKAHLQEDFGEEVLFLHGGTPARVRDRMIDRFQNDPKGPLVFILSLKAGGTGLNLMRANHVFHFDRWWNPAVEDQATDRAFRIGQVRNVQVYKYLSAGTCEEKIDDLIERKKALAESVVGAGEAWLTELSTEELRHLFALRRELVADV